MTTTHTTHIAGRIKRAPGANPLGLARQVFRPCCSCGWRGEERPNIESRAERLRVAEDDAAAHVTDALYGDADRESELRASFATREAYDEYKRRQ